MCVGKQVLPPSSLPSASSRHVNGTNTTKNILLHIIINTVLSIAIITTITINMIIINPLLSSYFYVCRWLIAHHPSRPNNNNNKIRRNLICAIFIPNIHPRSSPHPHYPPHSDLTNDNERSLPTASFDGFRGSSAECFKFWSGRVFRSASLGFIIFVINIIK